MIYPLSRMIFSWEYFSRYCQANISTKYFMRQKSVLHRVAQYFVHCGHLVHCHSRLSKPFTFSQKMFSQIFHWALKIHALYLVSLSWHILIFNRNWAISNLLLLIFGHQWPIHWYLVALLHQIEVGEASVPTYINLFGCSQPSLNNCQQYTRTSQIINIFDQDNVFEWKQFVLFLLWWYFVFIEYSFACW